MIRVSNLSKTFFVHEKEPGLMGSVKSLFVRRRVPRHAVRGVSFEIAEGEIVGLIGANGAGKTTLVKMLSGIVFQTGGEATVLGFRPWERKDDFRRQIALIMGQKAQLWWDLPAADCFLLLREIYQVDPARHRANLDRLVETLGVGGLLKTQVRRLSLGERMKMELIAALLHDPRVVFLDEPTIGLDLNAQRAIREFLLEYRRERSTATILTSHYMEDIERLCERIVIMREGAVVYDGRLARVVETYAPSKLLTATPAEGLAQEPSRAEMEEIGQIVEISTSRVRLHVPRRKVADAAARLMKTLPVSDLAIEEEDIGTIVSNIMAGGDAMGGAS